MSNDYYDHQPTFVSGDLARAEDVENEFNGVTAAFGKLPQPRPSGDGFLTPIYIGEAVEPGHAATRGQLITLEQQAESHKDAAATAQSGAETARTGAETAESNAQGHEATALTHANTASGHADTALSHANTALGHADDAATESGNAATSASLAQDWATGSGEIAPGLKSAKGYAEEAEATVAGARKYIGQHDASGGTYPIASPSSGDEGKYWIINTAGTLPVGAVDVGWELSINDSLDYEAANLLPANLVTEVNGNNGPAVTLTESDIPSIASTYLAAASYTASDVLAKMLTVDGAGSGLDADTVDGFQASYFLPAASYTASDVLTKVKTVDGAGSGLDADTVDGQQASAFFPASSVSSFAETLLDDASASAARSTLGLGTAATQNTGTASGTIPIRGAGGDVPGDITGNAATATKLASARTLSLTGDVTGSASFDGSGNAAITATVGDDSHNHTGIAKVADYSAPFNNASNTPRAFHNAGLCHCFVRSTDGWPIGNGKVLNIPSYTSSQDGGAMQILTPYQAGQTDNNNIMWRSGLHNNAGWTGWKTGLDKDYADSLYLAVSGTAAKAAKLATARTISIAGEVTGSTTFDGSANRSISATLSATAVRDKLKTVDGAGSGVDADLLDGAQGADYLKKSEFDPASFTQVWSGSSSAVAMSALSESGPGFYVVEDGFSSQYLVGIRSTSSIAASAVRMLEISADITLFMATFDSSNFEIRKFTLSSDTDSIGAAGFSNIEKIFKA